MIFQGVYQGVLGMVLLMPFWEIFNRQIGHLGMKIWGILHDFRIVFIGKGSFYHTLRKARKIPLSYTVKPVLRGHFCVKEKVAF